MVFFVETQIFGVSLFFICRRGRREASRLQGIVNI